MKCTLVLLLFLCSFSALAQKRKYQGLKFGIRAGAALTEATCIPINGLQKKGFTGGFLFQLKLDKNWTGEIDVLFIQKGSRNSGDPRNNHFGYYLLRLDYVECPVLFRYHRKKLIYEFGPGFGYLVFAREFRYDDVVSGQGNLSNDNPFSQSELSFNIGLSYALNQAWTISTRYTSSLLQIRESTANSSRYDKIGTLNCVLAFTLVHTFQFGDEAQNKRNGVKQNSSE